MCVTIDSVIHTVPTSKVSGLSRSSRTGVAPRERSVSACWGARCVASSFTLLSPASASQANRPVRPVAPTTSTLRGCVLIEEEDDDIYGGSRVIGWLEGVMRGNGRKHARQNAVRFDFDHFPSPRLCYVRASTILPHQCHSVVILGSLLSLIQLVVELPGPRYYYGTAHTRIAVLPATSSSLVTRLRRHHP